MNPFYDLLENRSLKTLYSRLQHFPDFDGNVPIEGNFLPIDILLGEIRYHGRYSPYYIELLFWVVERTTPTKELLERLAYSADDSAFKPLEELVKRYTSERLTFDTSGSYYSLAWMEILLGYSLLNLEEMVEFEENNYVLPIEYAILTYTLDCRQFSTNPLECARLLYRHGSPSPNVERMSRTISIEKLKDTLLLMNVSESS